MTVAPKSVNQRHELQNYSDYGVSLAVELRQLDEHHSCSGLRSTCDRRSVVMGPIVSLRQHIGRTTKRVYARGSYSRHHVAGRRGRSKVYAPRPQDRWAVFRTRPRNSRNFFLSPAGGESRNGIESARTSAKLARERACILRVLQSNRTSSIHPRNSGGGDTSW